MKNEKNYFRSLLKELIPLTNGLPIIISAKYKHRDNSDWATFTTVRPYIPNTKTKTICSHINVRRNQVQKWFSLNEEYHNRKFYIIGYPFTYSHYGDERGRLMLAEDIGIRPICFNTDRYIVDDVLKDCYCFEEEIYKR